MAGCITAGRMDQSTGHQNTHNSRDVQDCFTGYSVTRKQGRMARQSDDTCTEPSGVIRGGTNSMEPSPASEANGHSSTQEIPCLL